ncbi:hypothetical protein BWQ96_07340 [Gracilariopsis chorda]|uniref:Nudix hydrolase domain-containing protein n=1 Tax=Gracilariopsis chorda TaxID=448386 RepID=A0A2V3ILF7_9FLOR|nr:hypothetical protein BWQ96_07340 [Gracilariopsis chorda]|eukprot:PXF42893.1 hypothetical protein BWQ96_07340 [Gracilariopsis chorda]
MKGSDSSPPLRALLLLVLLAAVALTLYLSPLSTTPPHPDTTTTSNLLKALQQRQTSYKVLSDKVVYDRYARVYSRQIRFPDGRQFDFDVWGRVWKNDSFAVVTVVPFDRPTKTFTLVREYNIAHARYVYSFPQGQYERSKHRSIRHGAAAELEEEAHLQCDEWVNLLHNDLGRGAPQDKYQRETVHYFLCTAAHHVQHAADRDEEENIEVVRGVTATQLRQLVAAGALQSNNIAAALMALHELSTLRLLPYTA